MSKILVVDDAEHIVELIKFNLESEGYEVIPAYDGKEALKCMQDQKFDLILLDLMLPGIDGIEICRRLRSNPKTKDIPIIMITAKGEEIDKVLGLELGADDYMTKPFSVRELVARVKAMLRRMNREKNTEEDAPAKTIEGYGILMDLEKHEVLKDDQLIDLTYKEFELLKILFEHKGKVLTRDYLLDKIWGYDYIGETRTVDVHIRHLRKKLEDDENMIIETIRGVGYKIK